MTSDSNAATLVVLGLDREGTPHAARFGQDDTDLAKRAAAITGLRMIAVADPELVPIAASLPEGRVLRGNAIIPAVAADVYAKLAALIPADTPAAAPPKTSVPAGKVTTKKPATARENIDRLWSAVKVGDVVLACPPRTDYGWWPAVVLAIVHGDRLRVRYRDYADEPPFTVRRQTIGLMHPSHR